MNLEFFVRDLRLTCKAGMPVAADTNGFYTFSMAFDEPWEDLVKVVVFQNGSETAQLVYTGQTWLPPNVCRRGNLYVACHGYRRLGDTTAVLRTVRMLRPVRILNSAPMAGGDPGVYTPSVFETVMGAAASAMEAEQSLRAAAAAGVFRGEPGLPGKTPVKGVDYWTQAERDEMVQSVLAALPQAEGTVYG